MAFFKVISDVKRSDVSATNLLLSEPDTPQSFSDASLDSISAGSSQVPFQKARVQNIVVNAAEFDVNLISSGVKVVNFCMQSSQFGLVLRSSKTSIKLTVGRIELQDPNAREPLYRRVLTIVDESSTFFEMQIDLFDLDDLSDQNDPLSPHGNVFVRAGSIHYVFVYKFMERLAFAYPDEFSTDEAISAPITVQSPAKRKRSDLSTMAQRYKPGF